MNALQEVRGCHQLAGEEYSRQRGQPVPSALRSSKGASVGGGQRDREEWR